MPRVDAGDVCSPESVSMDLGFPRGFEDVFEVGPQIGKGGFGTVKKVYKRATHEELACKILSKTLAPNLPCAKQRQHLDTMKREVAVLKVLRGTLNVVNLDSVYEDDENVYIIMEYCKGGELFHRIGLKPYSEETVARIMRAVLRTLAQCHSRGILHRDVKPGNFMFLKSEELKPIKAVDFGLAVFFDRHSLPRRDLGFDGTPWFMAPEVLSSEVGPESDVWSAGVMAHQLLTGHLPFDDKKNPNQPALSLVWRSILTEDVNFRKSYWMGVSEPAKDFVRQLLVKDPAKRLSAREALEHPWVKKGGSNKEGRPFSATIVQKIQRFAQSSVLKRTVLDMIANELVHAEMNMSNSELLSSPYKFSPVRSSPVMVDRTWHNGGHLMGKGSGSVPFLAFESADMSSPDFVKSGNSVGRLSGLKSKLQHRRYSFHDLSVLSDVNFEDWEQRRKAARLALDTSVHGPGEYPELVKSELKSVLVEGVAGQEDSPPSTPLGVATDGEERPSDNLSKIYQPEGVSLKHTMATADWQICDEDHDEIGGRGQSLFKNYLEGKGTILAAPVERSEPILMSRAASCGARSATSLSRMVEKSKATPMGSWKKTEGQLSSLLSGGMNTEDAKRVLDEMNLTVAKGASHEDLMAGLQNLGFEIDKHELSLLIESMAPANDGHVQFSQFLASQLDWHNLQHNHHAKWLTSVRQAFKGLDKDGDGRISSQDLVQAIGEKLPALEVEAAVEQAKMEACAEELDMDFESFVGMLQVDSCENLMSLEQYDSRHGLQAYVGSLETVEEI